MCKSQLKAFYQFGKGIQSELVSHHVSLKEDIRKFGSDVQLHFPTISSLYRENEDFGKKVSALENDMLTLQKANHKLADAVERNL